MMAKGMRIQHTVQFTLFLYQLSPSNEAPRRSGFYLNSGTLSVQGTIKIDRPIDNFFPLTVLSRQNFIGIAGFYSMALGGASADPFSISTNYTTEPQSITVTGTNI